ncbi:delta 4, 5-alpha steroid dehydrogenase [Paraburkholderia ginsengiterrae]|uniref:Delta 4, 5-alpha steroid dehydrogenase n=1 Tax=Paraburkholderia ginsengiterrae TaxID=1462993 RepID=A0A1A9N2X1_9BURK|nr:FAD-binding protein [Paraburkholderia ginsengiterrae]OAJ53190.1 delta 4, 5-alpha steroid dehydrogenase [Paraburkholderia ginsengiterrae]OAJ55889.1 delta 4, 5-alpha steroid dehydrogenase [Paraburkholderia ginsengiterrae]
MHDSSSSEQGFATPVEAPLVVDDPARMRWDDVCDVLVAGFGAAGACAALEAAAAGAKVRIVERFEGGGASAKSGGVVYAGGGTQYQSEAGYVDTPQAMFAYLQREVGEAVSAATLERFCAGSVEMLRWLERLGVRFAASMPPRKTSYPQNRYYLYYSGNEAVGDVPHGPLPAPRGHRVVGDGMSGRVLYDTLRRAVEAQPSIDAMCHASVRRLVTDRSGRVIGAQLWQVTPGRAQRAHRRLARRAERLHNAMPAWADRLRAALHRIEMRESRLITIKADAVVLSTGGFIFNRSMVARHAPRYLPNWRLGTTGCDGSGIRLGLSAGGVASRLERVSAWRFINPPYAWAQGCVVDRHGERFCNEEVYGAALGHAMCEKREGRAWLILDARLVKLALKECLRGKLWAFQSVPALLLMLAGRKRGASLADLAARIGCDPAVLAKTVVRYNTASLIGVDREFGKSAAMLQPLSHGPYYAIDISADSRVFPCPSITLGGLRVDETSNAVLSAQGEPVEGLFAAGRAACGLASNHYVSGLSLADCIWSGRQAGRAAAGVVLVNRAHSLTETD